MEEASHRLHKVFIKNNNESVSDLMKTQDTQSDFDFSRVKLAKELSRRKNISELVLPKPYSLN